MRAILFLALIAVCKGGYPANLPEVVASSDEFGAPPETPIDSYSPPQSPSDSYGAPVKAPLVSFAPPTKVSVNVAPLQETLPAPAPESTGTEIVAAAPAPSATFNFLSELTAPPLVTLDVAETNQKATPAVQQETNSAPLIEQFQLNIPGLVPPITNLPPPPVVVPPITSLPPPPVVVPPIQVLPPTILPPPQTSFSAPVPVQSAPVQPAPIPVQTLTLGSNPAPAPVTKITAQEITVPRIQTAFIPQENFQLVLPAVTPYNYAPYFFQQNTLPAAFFAPRKVLPQLAVNPQLSVELLNLQPGTPNAAVETSAVKTAQTLVEPPSTSYGTPILETLQKKK